MYKILFFLTLFFLSFSTMANDNCHYEVETNITNKESVELNKYKEISEKQHKHIGDEKNKNHKCNPLICDCPSCSHCSNISFIFQNNYIKKNNIFNYKKIKYTYSVKEFFEFPVNPPPIFLV